MQEWCSAANQRVMESLSLFSEKVQVCYELCRLQNDIKFWVVWLPTGGTISIFLALGFGQLPFSLVPSRTVFD